MSGADTPAAHAVLGLLGAFDRDEGAGHGYDLARHFAPGQPLAEVMRLEPGMLYHYLKKLAAAGWASATIEPRGTRPPRQVYRITDGGRTELQRWLSEPVARTREIRLEFLLKLFFARRLDPALAARLVDEQRAIIVRLETSLAAQLASATAEDHDQTTEDAAAFRRLVLELRLAQTRAALAWLQHVDR